MQKEPGLYEIPAERLAITYEGGRLGEGSDLGQAVVVSTLFGKTRVRIVREGDQPRWLWPMFAVLVAGAIAAAAWFWMSAPRDEPVRSDVPELIPAPPAPPVVEIPATAPQPAVNVANPAVAVAEKSATPEPETQPKVTEPAAKAAPKKPAVERRPEAAAEAAHEPTHAKEGQGDTAASPSVPSDSAKPAKRAVKKALPVAAAPAGESASVSASVAPPPEGKAAKPAAKKESPSVSPEAKPQREDGVAALLPANPQPTTANEPRP